MNQSRHCPHVTVNTSVAALGTKVPRRGFVEIDEAKQTWTDPSFPGNGLKKDKAMESPKRPAVDGTADAPEVDRPNGPTPTTAGNSPGDIAPTTARDHFFITLAGSLTTLTHKFHDLLSRYKEAGTKYHSMPLAARSSTHLEATMASLLVEVYTSTPAGRLAPCVAESLC